MAAARAVESGQTFDLMVGGQIVTLEPDEVLMDVTSPEGYAVAARSRLLVALNTTLTPELVMEGQSRDLVRFIQDARKSADFDISDRIRATLQAVGEIDLEALLKKYGDYVKAETLATSLQIGKPEEGAFTAEADLNTAKVLMGLKR